MMKLYNYSTNKYKTYYTEEEVAELTKDLYKQTSEKNILQKEHKEIKDKLNKIEKLAKHYFRITCGAGGQSMNIQDRHYGMSQVGKEILEIIKGE